MVVTKLLNMTALGMCFCLGAVGCAASGGGDDTGDDDVAPRPDGAPLIADDGAVLGDPALIDDLEDGDGAIHEIIGRIGAWYSFNDGTAGGMQTPSTTGDFLAEAGGASDSAFAARTTGKGFTEWGSGVGFDLNNPGEATVETKGKWDASAYTGLAFEAKGNVGMRVSIMEIAVLPILVGGTCTPSTVEGMECEDGHGKLVTLTSEWKTYELPFAMLKQEGWGKPQPFDPATITSIHFGFAKGLTWDVSIDNVRFY